MRAGAWVRAWLVAGALAAALACGGEEAGDVAGGADARDAGWSDGASEAAEEGVSAELPDAVAPDAPPAETDAPDAFDEGSAPRPDSDEGTEPWPEADASEAEGPGDAPGEVAEGPRLVILPEVPHLGVGHSLTLRAWLVAPGAAPQDVSAEATWSSAAPEVLQVGPGGAIEALTPGEARVAVTLPGAEEGALVFPVERAHQVEVRALWVTRWQFDSAQDVETILDEARDAGLNVLFFQVRGRFDALYRSDLEPWAKELTGTLGKDPGWDPLRTALDGAHARGLELHAWINVFSLWSGSTAPDSVGVPHAYTTHPEWRMVDQAGTPMPLGSGEYVWASPGLAAVRDWNVAVVQDLVTRYPDLDGVHLDRIRYPGPGWSFDSESVQGHQAAQADDPDLSFADYRRQRVDEQVAAIHSTLRALAPNMLLSAAVAANYDNAFGWSSVSVGYTDHFQDSRAWLIAGTIDWICPMAYWPLSDPYGQRTDFAALTDDWLLGRPWADQIVMGLSADYAAFQEIDDQLAWVRGRAGRGVALYDRASLLARGHYPSLATGPFADPALLPFAWWRADMGPPGW